MTGRARRRRTGARTGSSSEPTACRSSISPRTTSRKNALYWDGANRYRAAYLTAWNVRGYGVYVEDGEQESRLRVRLGRRRAAYYVGECRPCGATIAQVVARSSAVGYSGTNATGVVVRDSTWDRNGAGIVPNTYANEALPPQARTKIVHNTVTSSGRARVPIRTALAGSVGIGVAVAGGNDNVIARNRIVRSERYGVAVFPTALYVSFDPAVPSRPAVAPARKPRLATRSRGAARPTSRSRAARAETTASAQPLCPLGAPWSATTDARRR